MDAHIGGQTLAFEGWRFDRQALVLFRENATGRCDPVSLGSRALAILALLLEQPGTLVSKDTLIDSVWRGLAVEPQI